MKDFWRTYYSQWYHASLHHSTDCILITKEEKSLYNGEIWWRSLNQVTITNDKMIWHLPLHMINKKHTASPMSKVFASVRKKSDKFRSCGIFYNITGLDSSEINIIADFSPKKVRKCFRLKATKETWELNTIPNS